MGRISVGWYRYPGGGGKVVDPLVEDLVVEEAYFAKVERVSFSAEEIQHRILIAMINEAASILGEGIALKASDIDLVLVHGYGFPRWRGGLMHYADTLGASHLLKALETYSLEDAYVWKPSQVIVECAAANATLESWERQ